MAAVVALQSALQASKYQVGAAACVAYQHSPYSTDAREIINLAALKRGTGGRSSFNGVVATVFGASGFLGRYVCNRLGKTGTQLIIPYRGDHYDVIRLKVVGDLGQVLFQPYNLLDYESIQRCVKYSNVVINLVGRDWETKCFKFDDVHVEGARLIARAAREACVEKLIHVSAHNACENPEPLLLKCGSQFFASKWRGENAVREEFPDAVIFRPSTIYGQEDRFLRNFVSYYRYQLNFIPIWKKGEHTVKQPVHVSDVAAGIVAAVKDRDVAGKTFYAIGPKRYRLSDLVDWFHATLRREIVHNVLRYDLRYDPIYKFRITLNELICPGWPLGYIHWEGFEKEATTDQRVEGEPTLEDLGVTLTNMEDQVPWELRPFRAKSYYHEELAEFEKPANPPVC